MKQAADWMMQKKARKMCLCSWYECPHRKACLRKARDLVFWPSMNAEIKEAVTNCSICAEFQAKQQKQPMQSHEIPDRPWSRLSSDLFTLHNKEYIVLVDSYSDYVEVSQLKATTTTALIEFFKEQFSRHGIPDILMTDNGPQYTSREFTEFTREWEFKHLTLSFKIQRQVRVCSKGCKESFQESDSRQERPLAGTSRLQKHPN